MFVINHTKAFTEEYSNKGIVTNVHENELTIDAGNAKEKFEKGSSYKIKGVVKEKKNKKGEVVFREYAKIGKVKILSISDNTLSAIFSPSGSATVSEESVLEFEK